MRRGICSACAEHFSEKPATVFVAWRDTDQERRAYRMQWCRDCTYNLLNPTFEKVLSNPSYGHCLTCGEPLNSSGTALIWLTIFLPRAEREDGEWWYCQSCAEDKRNELVEGGELQPNRPGFGTAGSPITAAPWPMLGQARTVAETIRAGRTPRPGEHERPHVKGGKRE